MPIAIGRTLFIAGAASLLLSGSMAAEDQPEKRRFLGSFRVSAERRDEAIKFLREKGFKGAFVPEGAVAETLLYRGPKEEYEAALDALDRYLHPEWYKPRGPIVNPKKETPEELAAREDKKLGVSALQKQLLDELRKEGKTRWEAIQKKHAGDPVTLSEKGAEQNLWWRDQWKAVLTREQYRLWAPSFADIDLGPEPKLPAIEPGAKKSDEAIFSRLGLSVKQKEHSEKLQAEVKKIRDRLAIESSSEVIKSGLAEAKTKWLEGLEKILTGKQYQEFKSYWELK